MIESLISAPVFLASHSTGRVEVCNLLAAIVAIPDKRGCRVSHRRNSFKSTILTPGGTATLLVGSMQGKSLFRIRLEAGPVLYSEPIWIGQRIRDLTQTEDGTIVIWTDDTQLLFVSVDKDKLAEKRLAPAFLGEVAAGGCLGCHHFGPTHPGDSAPSLSNLFDRPIASDAFP